MTRWHELRAAIRALDVMPGPDRSVFRERLDETDYTTAELVKPWTYTQRQIARFTGYSVRQVKKSEAHLEHHGWLIFARTKTGPGKTRPFVARFGDDCYPGCKLRGRPM